MANILVDTNAIETAFSSRIVLRDANDFVYVFVNASGNIRAYKGNQAGEPTSFTEQDAVGAPDIASARQGLAVTIDSVGLVHVLYADTASGRCAPPEVIRYGQFRTSAHATTQDDWFLIDEQITTPVEDTQTLHSAIAIDANDDPHVVWSEFSTQAQFTIDNIRYNNRIGGTWSCTRNVNAVSCDRFSGVSLMIGDPLSAVGADRPIISASKEFAFAFGQIDASYGDALDACSFTTEADITGAICVFGASFQGEHIGMAIDSNDKITIAFIERTTKDLMVVEHLHANSWATWETPVDVDTSTDYERPTITIVCTDRFIFVEDATNNDINLWTATNGTWTEETCDDDLPNVGTFDFPISKWGSIINNSPNRLDYVFRDATGVLYNTFNSTPPPPSVPPPTKFVSRADTTITIATSDSSKTVSRTDTTNAINTSDTTKTISRKDTTKSINR